MSKIELASTLRDLNVQLKNLYFILICPPKSIFGQFHNIFQLTVRVILQKYIWNKLNPFKIDSINSFCSLNKVPVIFKILNDLVLIQSNIYSSAPFHKSHKGLSSLFFWCLPSQILLPFQGIFSFLYPNPTTIHLRNSYSSFKYQCNVTSQRSCF